MKKYSIIILWVICISFSFDNILSGSGLLPNEWIEKTPTPKQGGYGEAIVGTGEEIYVIRCMYASSEPDFWHYDPDTNIWNNMPTDGLPIGAFRSGSCLTYDGNNLYALLGGRYSDDNRTLFYKFYLNDTSWEQLANTPHAQGAGDALTYCGYDGNLYAFIGSKEHGSIFARYFISNDTWQILPSIWNKTDDGCSLIWAGDEYLYALQGEVDETLPNTNFARFNVVTKEWEELSYIPEDKGVGDGASLLWIESENNYLDDFIFALGGGGADESPGYNFYCYCIDNDTWIKLGEIPYPVGYYVGNRLAYANDSIYYWQGTPSTWEGGGNKFCKWCLIKNIPPVANFTFYPLNPTSLDTINFTESSYDPDGYIINYTWYFDDGYISYEQNPTHKYNDDGVYNVTLVVTDNNGVVANVTKQIIVINSPPFANFSYTPSYPYINELINFTDLSYDPDGFIVNWTWNFGDGNVSYVQNPSHKYAKDGTYNVTLTVTDDDGAIATIFKQISVAKTQYSITISVEPNEAGYIELDPSGETYFYGTLVTLTAIPNEDYEFSHWDGDVAGVNPTIQIIMDSNKTIVAYFIPINQPPTVIINSPSENQELSGITTIKGKANDDSSIEKVEIKIDNGKWIIANGKYNWYYTLNTKELKNGHHIIYARSYDGESYSKIVSVNVTIFNNLNKPCIVILEPTNGTVVKGKIILRGKAWDLDGNETIKKVEIRIENEWKWHEATGKNNWTYLWNTKTLESNGYYTIYAKAWDGEKYSEIRSVTIFVNNLIHLQVDHQYKGFVTPDIPQEHWITLYKNKTYEISIEPSYSGNKADFKLEIVNFTIIDENAKGYGEKYTFKCNKTDIYYIKVFSDVDTKYYIEIQESHKPTIEEILKILGFLGVIVIIAFIPAITDFLHEKIRKAKLTIGSQIIFSILDYIIGIAVIYTFLTQIYEMSKNPSLKNAFILSFSAFVYTVYKYLRMKKAYC